MAREVVEAMGARVGSGAQGGEIETGGDDRPGAQAQGQAQGRARDRAVARNGQAPPRASQSSRSGKPSCLTGRRGLAERLAEARAERGAARAAGLSARGSRWALLQKPPSVATTRSGSKPWP